MKERERIFVEIFNEVDVDEIEDKGGMSLSCALALLSCNINQVAPCGDGSKYYCDWYRKNCK